MTKLVYALLLAGFLSSVSTFATAKEIDPNELLCYSLVLELLESQEPTQEQIDAWRYLRCAEYEDEIAPAVAAFLGSKEYSDR